MFETLWRTRWFSFAVAGIFCFAGYRVDDEIRDMCTMVQKQQDEPVLALMTHSTQAVLQRP